MRATTALAHYLWRHWGKEIRHYGMGRKRLSEVVEARRPDLRDWASGLLTWPDLCALIREDIIASHRSFSSSTTPAPPPPPKGSA
jgi:hypothetical protein